MKKRILGICILFCHSAFGQNLVPNPGFENYSSCPLSTQEIERAIPWFQPVVPFGSTDYYNVCASIASYVNVPANIAGYQFANNGNGYAGFTGYGNYGPTIHDAGREYLEVKLNTLLQEGKNYFVSFYVSRGDFMQYAIDAIGAYFSTDTVKTTDYFALNQYVPQVINSKGNIIRDTMNWVLISGSFVANGSEQFMTIGNFNTDSLTQIDSIGPAKYEFAYYYIDDVSVIEDTTTSIDNGQLTIDNGMRVYPNPFKNLVSFTFADKGNSKKTLTVENELGEVVYRKEMSAAETIDLSFLSKEVYFVSVATRENVYRKKLIKVE